MIFLFVGVELLSPSVKQLNQSKEYWTELVGDLLRELILTWMNLKQQIHFGNIQNMFIFSLKL